MEAKDVLQRCPLCQEAYRAGSVCALDQAPGRPSRYHCYCQACKRAMVAILHETSGWLSSIGMLTEFTADEAVRAGELAPIDAEACLQAHRAFGEDGRSFCAFLQKQAKKPSAFPS